MATETVSVVHPISRDRVDVLIRRIALRQVKCYFGGEDEQAVQEVQAALHKEPPPADGRHLGRELAAAATQACWRLLYDRYYAMALATACKMLRRQHPDVGDVAEEALTRVHLFCSRGLVEQPERLGAIVRKTAARLCLDLYRQPRCEDVDAIAEPGIDPSTLLDMELENALDRLDLEQRKVIEMSFFDGRSQREIADELGICPGTVKSRKWRALEDLRRAALGIDGSAPTPPDGTAPRRLRKAGTRDGAGAASTAAPVGSRLLDCAGSALARREHALAYECLEAYDDGFEGVPDPGDPQTPRYLDYLGRLVDARHPELEGAFRQALRRFDEVDEGALSVRGRLHLLIAQGTGCLLAGEFAAALPRFDHVLDDATLLEAEDEVTALHGRARALRMATQYEDALRAARAARERALAARRPQAVWVIDVLIGWIHYKLGQTREARAAVSLLPTAVQELDPLVHARRLVLIHRIERREGNLARAIEAAEAAIGIYRTAAPRSRNLARVLVSLAFTRGVVALRDGSMAARRQGLMSHDPVAASIKRDLDAARAIYEGNRCPRGEAMIALCEGYVLLKQRQFEAAWAKAEDVVRAGQARADRIDPLLSVRGLILCTQIAWDMGEGPRDASSQHPDFLKTLDEVAEKAVRAAREAVRIADLSQSERLKGRAHAHLGLSCILRARVRGALGVPELARQDEKEARDCYLTARRLLDGQRGDYVWCDLGTLEAELQTTLASHVLLLFDRALTDEPRAETRAKQAGKRKKSPTLMDLLKRDFEVMVVQYLHGQGWKPKDIHRRLGIHHTDVLSIINHGRKQRVQRDGTPVDGQFDASQSRQASLHENTNGS